MVRAFFKSGAQFHILAFRSLSLANFASCTNEKFLIATALIRQSLARKVLVEDKEASFRSSLLAGILINIGVAANTSEKFAFARTKQVLIGTLYKYLYEPQSWHHTQNHHHSSQCRPQRLCRSLKH